MSHLSAVSRVLTSKPPMPVLESLLFDLSSDGLRVTASDGDCTIIAKINIEDVEGAGRFVVPVKTLLEPLKEMPQQMLTFEIDPENFEIFVNYANGKYNFIAQSADEYPCLKQPEPDVKTLKVSASALLSGINSTIFAVAEDEIRPVMNGIYFDIKPDHITFVASDSKKLVRLINKSVQAGFEGSFILRRKPANLLRGIISKEMQDVVISYDSKTVRIQVDDYQISSSLIEGKFPPYEAVIPKNNTNRMTIDRQECIKTLRRVAVFANPATNQVKFELDKDQLTISAQDIDYSVSGFERIGCSYDCTPLQIGFRANFLIEILNSIPSEEVEFQMSDSFRACLVVPVINNQDEDLLMLIMPMQLADFNG